MEHAYCHAANFLHGEWRAGRASSEATWAALRALHRPPSELRRRSWRRVTMRALYWLLRVLQPLELRRPLATRAHTAAAREAALSRLGQYLTNAWYALRRCERGVVPRDLQAAEQTLATSVEGFDVLRTLPAPRVPPEPPRLNEP